MRLPKIALAVILIVCPSVLAQHDLHRNTMRVIAQGKYEKALEALSRKPDDPESLYLMMLTQSLLGNVDQALELARKATEAGLPFERILAGPRDALAALTGSDEFKEWAAEQAKQLVHGPTLGSVTGTSARVWVRTAQEAEVTVVARPTTPPGSLPVFGSKAVQSSRGRDHTAVVTVTGLSPDTDYHYGVFLDGESVMARLVPFRTYPAAGAKARFTVGFGGGAGYIPKNERMWDVIAKRKPRAFLLLGDNVYIDDPKHPLTHRYCYYRRQSRPEFRRFAASSSLYAIYDDHDFGTNDCVPGPETEVPAWKRSVWRIFTENWCNPAYGGGEEQPGCWHDFMIGDVHFILLDGRYYRDLKGGSMLGSAQKAWLYKKLKASTATFKILASPVPWSAGVKPGSKDTWDGFAAEREEVFSFIEKHRIPGVLLLAADRHRSDIRKTPRANGYGLIEFESSRLTNRHVHRVVQTPGLVFGYNKTCSFGLLHFDTTLEDPKVTFEIVNIAGERVYTYEVRLSDVSP